MKPVIQRIGQCGVSQAGRGRRSGEDGATMVEFALILPMLLLILMGIIEFGWMFTQAMEVRHSAREGARMAAVNYDGENTSGPDQTTVIRDEMCRRMSTDDPSTVDIRLVDNTKSKVGEYGIVAVERSHQTLSNFFPFFPSTLSTEVEFRLERPASWSATVGVKPCP